MQGINKAIIVGTLGKDPEVRYSGDGKAIANISVATSEKWKDKNSGQQQEKTEWHRVCAFDRLAEIMGEYLTKGSQVYIDGKIQTRKWQDNDGNDRYSTEIVANQMQMLGGGNKQQSQGQQQQQGGQQQAQQSGGQTQGGAFNDFDDDIPFLSFMRGTVA